MDRLFLGCHDAIAAGGVEAVLELELKSHQAGLGNYDYYRRCFRIYSLLAVVLEVTGLKGGGQGNGIRIRSSTTRCFKCFTFTLLSLLSEWTTTGHWRETERGGM